MSQTETLPLEFLEATQAFMRNISLRSFTKDEIMFKRVIEPSYNLNLIPDSLVALYAVEIVDWMLLNWFKRGLEI